MSYSLYGDFSIDEARDIGTKHKVICHASYGYNGQLTVGNVYTITITSRMLSRSPLCSFINDKGIRSEAHLTRFTKVKSTKDIKQLLVAINNTGKSLFKYPIGNEEFTNKLKDYELLKLISFNEITGLWERI